MILEDVINFLKSVPPFQFLEDAVLKTVAGSLSMEFYPRDMVILKQDGPPSDSVRIIKKGGVKILRRSENGDDIIMEYRGEGDSFGFLSLIGKDKQKTTVTAVDDTICYILKKEKVIKLIESSPSFAEYFMAYLTSYVDRTYREMHNKTMMQGSTDRLLFTTKAGDIATDVLTIDEDTTIQEAADIMTKEKISSVIIVDKRKLPVGIVTDKDLRGKVVARGRDIHEPIKNIMTISLIRVDAMESCFEAVLKMIKYNIHHILVIKDGELKGVMTNHDLMVLQGASPLSFAHDIENQRNIDGLIPVSVRVNNIIGLLLKEGAKASSITNIATEINDRFVKKVLEIAERNFGAPPVPYCWVVFGSEGRKEQTFKTDQDNAIIYADTATEDETRAARQYFSVFTAFVKESLMKIGFPSCPADYMASNAQWCQPLSIWKKYFRNWISEPTPDAILKSLIFFDLRPIYGKISLSEELVKFFFAMAGENKIFLGQMANTITKNTPPVGFFKSFVVEKSGEHKNTFDLKMKGSTPLVDILRLFALEGGAKETSTLGRIQALRVKHHVVRQYADELAHAFEFIMLLRIHHQFEQIKDGKAPDNFINPNNLSNLEKKTIKEAFQLISRIQGFIIETYKPLIR